MNVCTVYVNKTHKILSFFFLPGLDLSRSTASSLHQHIPLLSSASRSSGVSRPILKRPPSPATLRGNPRAKWLSLLASVAGVIQTRRQISLKEEWSKAGEERTRSGGRGEPPSSPSSPRGRRVDCVLHNKHHNWQFAPVAGHGPAGYNLMDEDTEVKLRRIFPHPVSRCVSMRANSRNTSSVMPFQLAGPGRHAPPVWQGCLLLSGPFDQTGAKDMKHRGGKVFYTQALKWSN